MKKSILIYVSLCMALLATSCSNDLKDDYEYEAFKMTSTETPTDPTVKEPSISNLTVSDVTKTSASCTVSYTSSDLSVLECGVCYSSSSVNPTTSNATKSISRNDKSGSVTLSLTGLDENTTYYIRPYVKTSAGTTYGNTVQFTTLKTNSPNKGDNPTPGY